MTALPCLSGNCTAVVRGHPAAFPSPGRPQLCVPRSREPWESPRGCHAIQHRRAADRRFEAQWKPCLKEGFERPKSFPVDAKGGRQKSLKEGRILARAAAPPQGPSLPPSWPTFCACWPLLPAQTPLPAAAVRSRHQRAKSVGALTWISPRSEEAPAVV